MDSYDIALVVSVVADSYEEAVSFVKQYEGNRFQVIDTYEHDNEGQRVFYLHPEDKPWALTEDG